MFFTHRAAEALGDWLECESIRQSLLEARPDLASRIMLHPHRPMLRIRRQAGDLLIAKMRESEPAPWLVGSRGGPSEGLQEVATPSAVSLLVLSLLEEE